MSWTDRDGRPVDAPEPPASGSYYTEIGDFQGAAYERNAFALGTAQEAAFLWEALELQTGQVLLDVGCGTGRHTRALADRGVRAIGLDISQGLLQAARHAADFTAADSIAASSAETGSTATGSAATGSADDPPRRPVFLRADARAIPLADHTIDAAICLCQGGFGITPGGDRAILAEIARVLRPGGKLALTAFSLVFAARFLAPEDAIDVERGLVWSPAEVRGPDDERRRYDLWTSCYSAGELRQLLTAAGFGVEALAGVEPGAYGLRAPRLTDPELLVLATRLADAEPRTG